MEEYYAHNLAIVYYKYLSSHFSDCPRVVLLFPTYALGFFVFAMYYIFESAPFFFIPIRFHLKVVFVNGYHVDCSLR